MPRLLLIVPSTSYRAEEFTEAASRLGVELTVASDHQSTLARGNPSGLLALDFTRPAMAAARAVQFAREHPVRAVVGVDDASMPVAAAIAAALKLPHNSPEAIAAARDKHRMREVLAAAGLPGPSFHLRSVDEDPEVAAGAAPYPCVVKPLVLSASRGVIRANNRAEFTEAFRRVAAILSSPELSALGEQARKVLVESYLPGDEIALEGLLTDGKLRVLCLFDKPDPLEGPFFEETLYVTPSRLPAEVQDQASAAVQAAVTALGLQHGPVHAELRVSDQGPRLLEVNPRSIGGRCSRVLRFGTGLSLEELILRHALGVEVPTFEREVSAAGVMMLPIPGAGTLVSIGGQAEARAIPGIEEVLITAHPGQEIVPLPEGAPYLGFVFARGETPEGVERALREAHRRLEFVIRSS